MEPSIPCSTHLKELVAICFSKCDSGHLCCLECLVEKHSSCANVVLLEKFMRKDISRVFALKSFAANFSSDMAEAIAQIPSQSKIGDKIESVFVSLMDKISVKVNETRQKMVEYVGKVQSLDETNDEIFNILGFKSIASELESKNPESAEKLLSSSTLVKKDQKSVSKLKSTLSKFEKYAKIEEKLEKLSMLEENLTFWLEEALVGVAKPDQTNQFSSKSLKMNSKGIVFESPNKVKWRENSTKVLPFDLVLLPQTGIHIFNVNVFLETRDAKIYVGIAERSDFHNSETIEEFLEKAHFFSPSADFLVKKSNKECFLNFKSLFDLKLSIDTNERVFSIEDDSDQYLHKSTLKKKSYGLFVCSEHKLVEFTVS